jgi:hypothetical protein
MCLSVGATALVEGDAAEQSTGNLQTRGFTTDCCEKKREKCHCCFDDEVNFNALDMHRIFSRKMEANGIEVNGSKNSLFTPDAQCVFPPFWTLVPGWSLNFKIYKEGMQGPFNPVAMEFEVPADFCDKVNVEVDLHLFARFQEPLVKNGLVQLQKEFARLVVVGSFAGKCEVLKPKVCVQKIVEVCHLGRNGGAPTPTLSPIMDGCKHFKVTFCLDAKKINPCDFGQLLVLRIPLFISHNDTQTRSDLIDCRELREFEGELILSAASFRYRKKECSRKECHPSKSCFLFKEVPTWPGDDAQPA